MKMKIVLSAASELRKQMNANDFILFFPFAIRVELNFGILIQFLWFIKVGATFRKSLRGGMV